MYILQNATKNLVRNKGRNILLAAVTFFIIAATVVTLTSNNAASKIIEDAKLSVGSKAEISMNLSTRRSLGSDFTDITMADYIEYGNSDYLRETILHVEVPIYSYTATAIDDEDRSEGTVDLNDGSTINMPTMMLVGNSSPKTLSGFGDKRNIIDGRMIQNDNECIISSDLARLNSLSAGDVISIESVFEPIQKYELTIAGIYSDDTEPYGDFTWGAMPYINKRNEIITTYSTVVAKDYPNNIGLDPKHEYYLKNPDQLKNFEKEVRAKGLPDVYDVTINQAAYDKMVTPLAGLKSTSFTFMVVILILGAIILMLFSSLAVRERKYEIGVLRAMGMEKEKVALGFISEAVMITVVCLILGLGAGSLIAQPVASSILEGQVEAAAAKNAGSGNKFLMSGGQTQIGDGTNNVEMISDIEVALGIDTLVQIIIIALLLTALSCVFSIVKITRFEPMKILMERN